MRFCFSPSCSPWPFCVHRRSERSEDGWRGVRVRTSKCHRLSADLWIIPDSAVKAVQRLSTRQDCEYDKAELKAQIGCLASRVSNKHQNTLTRHMVSQLSRHLAQADETAKHCANGIRTPDDIKLNSSFVNRHAAHKDSSRDRQVGLCPTCPRCRIRGKQITTNYSRPS